MLFYALIWAYELGETISIHLRWQFVKLSHRHWFFGIHAYTQTLIQVVRIHSCIHTYNIHAYIHTYIHASSRAEPTRQSILKRDFDESEHVDVAVVQSKFDLHVTRVPADSMWTLRVYLQIVCEMCLCHAYIRKPVESRACIYCIYMYICVYT